MDSEELLGQLADIHLPAEISYWPPAPGWWVLLVILLIVAFFAGRSYLKQQKLKTTCEFALAELDRCLHEFNAAVDGDASSQLKPEQTHEEQQKLLYINRFNSILRRVALWHYPNSQVASLGGDAWVDFIRKKGDSSKLTPELATALGSGRFQTRCDVDVNELHKMGRRWVRSLYLAKPTPLPSHEHSRPPTI